MKDHEGRPACYQGALRDIIIRTLALNARCQAGALRRLGGTPIVFIDDPAISACGSRLHLALERSMVLEVLTTLLEAVREEGALAGLHARQAVDWSTVFDSPAQILSLDAYRFGRSLVAYAEPLQRFVRLGGVVAWGIAPTLDDPFGVSAVGLQRHLKEL